MAPPGQDNGGRSSSGRRDALDSYLQLLAHRDRRLLVSTLAESGDGRLPLAILTDLIAAARPDDPAHETVVTELHHVHLPKLETEGVLEYDAEESIVSYRGDEQIEQFLHAVEQVGAD